MTNLELTFFSSLLQDCCFLCPHTYEIVNFFSSCRMHPRKPSDLDGDALTYSPPDNATTKKEERSMQTVQTSSRCKWRTLVAWLAAIALLVMQQVPVFAQSPAGVVSPSITVRDFGAKLDGVTDDSAALQAYFAAVGPTGTMVIPEGGVLYLENPVTLDLQGDMGFTFECRSPIKTSASLQNALTITNGYPSYIDFWVTGGGTLTDYSAEAPAGGTTALTLVALRGGEYRIQGENYQGRVVKISKQASGQPKTSMMRISKLRTIKCGQSMYVKADSAFGDFEDIYIEEDVYGPIIEKTHDVGISKAVCYFTGKTGFQFLNVGTSNLSNITCYGKSKSDVENQVEGPGNNIDLFRVLGTAKFTMNRCTYAYGKTGLYVAKDGGERSLNNNYNNITTFGNSEYGVHIVGCLDSLIEVNSDGDEVGLFVEGGTPNQVTANVSNAQKTGLILSDVSNVPVTGTFIDNNQSGAAGQYDIDLRAPGQKVLLHGVTATSEKTQANVNLPAQNQVEVQASTIGSYTNPPRKVEYEGTEAADAERPDPANWEIGDLVRFTDTGDGSGTGAYLLGEEGRWVKVAASPAPSEVPVDTLEPPKIDIIPSSGITQVDTSVSILDYGAKLDGVTDDSDALQAYYNAVGGSGTVYIPAGGVLYLEKGVTFDLGGKSGFVLRCDSPIKAKPGIGNAVSIVNGYPASVNFRLRDGGQTADYTQRDPEGGDQGLYLRGVQGGVYKVTADRYKGRVLRVDKALPGEPETKDLHFAQMETRSSSDKKNRCGQSFWMEEVSGVYMANAWLFWDDFGPVFRKVNDITIVHLENGWDHTGIRFEGCSRVHIAKFALGDETYTTTQIVVTSAPDGTRWKDFYIGTYFSFLVGSAMLVEHSEEDANFIIEGTVFASNDRPMVINDVHGFSIACDTSGNHGDGGKGLHIENSSDGTVKASMPGTLDNLDIVDSRNITVTGTVGGTASVQGVCENIRLESLILKGTLTLSEQNGTTLANGSYGGIVGTPHKRNLLGYESADAKTPALDNWEAGDIVRFTDLGDGSGSGYYQKSGETQWTPLWKENVPVAAQTDRNAYQVDDTITVTVTAPQAVERILLQNEAGNFLALQQTRTEDGIGGASFTLTFSLGSKGDRTLQVYTETNGTRTPATQISFSIGDYAPIPSESEPEAFSVSGPHTGQVNESLTYTIKTNTAVSKVALFNESGAGLAGTSSYVDEGDVRTWTYTIKVGSPGSRSLALKIKGAQNVWLNTLYSVSTTVHK